jgi:hypothetical protein
VKKKTLKNDYLNKKKEEIRNSSFFSLSFNFLTNLGIYGIHVFLTKRNYEEKRKLFQKENIHYTFCTEQ